MNKQIKLPKNYREADKAARDAGFNPIRQNGSHVIYGNSDGKTCPIPCHNGDLPHGTARSILRLLGLLIALFVFVYLFNACGL